MPDQPIRLNKFIAQSTEFSRRGADDAINDGRVLVNGIAAITGQTVTAQDVVTIDGAVVRRVAASDLTTVLFHKPVGYVCSRAGQGSWTIYDLLPPELHQLNPVGRLDKDSSGLLLLTNDGALANHLTHPRFQKIKVYEVTLNKPLQPLHQQMISDHGITLEDGVSKLQIEKPTGSPEQLLVTMREGRNRQIRRTFNSLGYEVVKLHRTAFGNYRLGNLGSAEFKLLQG